MDRRAFLRRAIGGTVVVTASVQSGWSLSTLRDLLGRLFRWQEQMPAGSVRVSELREIYQRTNLKLYRSYRMAGPEFSWMEDVPLEEIIPGSGRDNRIPLIVSRA